MTKEPTPLPDGIHLGNTDIEVENWQPRTSEVERPALPGQEHLMGAGWPAPLSVLGYKADGTPIYETPKGVFVTQAFIFCAACNITIKPTGGPCPGALCVNCFKGQHPAP